MQKNQEALSKGHKGNDENKVNMWTSLRLHQMTSLAWTAFFSKHLSKKYLKKPQNPAAQGSTLHSPHLWILQYLFLKCYPQALSPLFCSLSYIYTPQDTHSTIISIVLSMGTPSSLSWVTVKNPKQNASLVSTLFGIYFARFLAKYWGFSSSHRGWNSLHST